MGEESRHDDQHMGYRIYCLNKSLDDEKARKELEEKEAVLMADGWIRGTYDNLSSRIGQKVIIKIWDEKTYKVKEVSGSIKVLADTVCVVPVRYKVRGFIPSWFRPLELVA